MLNSVLEILKCTPPKSNPSLLVSSLKNLFEPYKNAGFTFLFKVFLR